MRAVLAAAIVLFGLILFLSRVHAREGQSNTPQNEKPQPEKAQNSKPENGKPQVAKTQGQFLVASRGLGDPLFEQSVVLMLPIKDGPLLVGLIVNKPSKIKVRELFPDSPGIEATDSMVYFGGPVDARVGARSAIFRSTVPRDKATQVFGDVYVTFDPGVVLALAENQQQAANVRVFVGRAQWDPEQFQGEVDAGAWHSLRSGADSIFTTLPEMLWPALIERTEPKPVVQVRPEGTLRSSGGHGEFRSFRGLRPLTIRRLNVGG
jgi:putative transcriptional regulator